MREVPHNLDAEHAVLGAMLLQREAISVAIERLTGSAFYDPSNSRIFETITTIYLQQSGSMPDPTVIADRIRNEYSIDTAETKRLLLQLQAVTPAAANIAHYVNIVVELALKRQLIITGQQITEAAYGPETADLILEESERQIFALSHRPSADTTHHIGTLADEAFLLWESGKQAETIKTGFYDIDESVRFRRQSLIVCAARPGQGKTAFALSVATKIAAEKPVLFFSMEMGTHELTTRIMCAESRVPHNVLQSGQINANDWTALDRAATAMNELDLYIDDNPRCTLLDITAKARRLITRKGPLGLIVVDYLQLMSIHGKNRESRQVEVAELSRGLKVIAREFDCPVLALSQLNRSVEYRADKTPMLADLRESGAIEQDADIVAFLHRDETLHNEDQTRRLIDFIIGKNRHGATGKTTLTFRADISRFDNYTG